MFADLSEIDRLIRFRKRPIAIPADMRPQWRIAVILLILRMASRGNKATFAKMHVLNWALRTSNNRETFKKILDGEMGFGTVAVRIEPSLNRALEVAKVEHLVGRSNASVYLTAAGAALADEIISNDNIFKAEKVFLNGYGKSITEQTIEKLFVKASESR